MPSPARAAAFRVLGALASHRIDLGEALHRGRDPLTDVRDRALATELVMGTLRTRGSLDHQLARLSAKPLHRLDASVLDALRLGAYQLLHLERVPTSAVVNDTVQLVKASPVKSAAGFVNAILRRLARERHDLPWPERPADDTREGRQALVEYLAMVHSHPAWLVQRWVDRYSVAVAEQWLQFNNDPPPVTLAANRLRGPRDGLAARLAAEGVSSVPTRTAPHGLMVTGGRVQASAAFADGACVIQDEASQLIAELAGATSGDAILDACASPGGKTLALAAQCGEAGLVVAADVRRGRVELLRDTMRRCRLPMVRVVHVPAAGPLPFRAVSFRVVLVDAPCSGLGTLRREPDIRWRRQPGELPALAAAQGQLLARIAPLVIPGGRLIYSTCSSEPEENESVVARFLARTHDFVPVPLSRLAGLDPRVRALATDDGFLRTAPTDGLEAFFGAVLEKCL